MQSNRVSCTARPNRTQFALVLFGCLFLLTACSSGYGMGFGLLGQVESTLRIVLVIMGGLLIVAGFAIHQFIIQVIGFIAGALAGALIGGLIGNGEGFAIFLGFIIGGFVGASLALALAYLTIFLGGFFAGVIIFGALTGAMSSWSPDGTVLVIGGIIGGVIMLILYRFWVTAMTAGLGSILFGMGTGAPVELWLVFFIVGIAVQYGLANVTGKGQALKPGSSEPQGGPVPPYTPPGAIPGLRYPQPPGAMSGPAYPSQPGAMPGPAYPQQPAPQSGTAYPYSPQPGAMSGQVYPQQPGAMSGPVYPPQISANVPSYAQQLPPLPNPAALPARPAAQLPADKVCKACGRLIVYQANFCPLCGKQQ